MRLRRILLSGAVLGLGYFVYAFGLWEPLRTTVVGVLGGLNTAGAILANAKARRLRPRTLEYLEIAAASAGVVALQIAVGRSVPGAGATLLLTALGGVGIGAGVVLAFRGGTGQDLSSLPPGSATESPELSEVEAFLKGSSDVPAVLGTQTGSARAKPR